MGKIKYCLLLFLKKIKGIPGAIKKAYKYEKFKKFAKVGKDLSLSVLSDCDADTPGCIEIGNGCEIFGRLESQSGGKIRIGDNTAIYNKSVVGSVESISIGNCVIISNHVHIYDNNNHPVDPEIRMEMCKKGFKGEDWRWKNSASSPVVIEDGVWIGEYSAILKGVTIGKGSVVGCHSVVTKDVPPYSVVAGNPARVVKELKK